MSPALALMPALAPEPPRAPEQLLLGGAPFLELLFEPSLRARAACVSRRHRPAPKYFDDASDDLAVAVVRARAARALADVLGWLADYQRARSLFLAAIVARAVEIAPLPSRRRAPPEPRKSRPAPKARVIRAKPLTDDERRALAHDERVLARWHRSTGLRIYRPDERGSCNDDRSVVDGAGTDVEIRQPCPFVSCSMHLYLDEAPRGGLKLNFPHLEPHEMKFSCALDIADLGGVSLEVVGEAFNISMERARQLVEAARQKGRIAVAEEDVEIDIGGRSFVSRYPETEDDE